MGGGTGVDPAVEQHGQFSDRQEADPVAVAEPEKGRKQRVQMPDPAQVAESGMPYSVDDAKKTLFQKILPALRSAFKPYAWFSQKFFGNSRSALFSACALIGLTTGVSLALTSSHHMFWAVFMVLVLVSTVLGAQLSYSGLEIVDPEPGKLKLDVLCPGVTPWIPEMMEPAERQSPTP